MPSASALIPVTESSQVGEARRAAARITELTHLNETDRGKVAIIVTELTNNLVRHSKGGEILIQQLDAAGVEGIEVLSIDRGPGMGDSTRCLQDGFSTGGTAGQGLGAVRRLASEFDIYTAQPSGTLIVARVLGPTPRKEAFVKWGVICLPVAGETACGDNWALAEKDDVFSLLLADGLGHGPLAAHAADRAVVIFNEDPVREPGRILEAVHAGIRSTRGAAVAVFKADLRTRALKYTGAGNISGTMIGDNQSRGFCSHNGTVGLQIHKIQEFDYPWPRNATIVMHSDGLKSRWDLAGYPGLLQRHPSLIAAALYRDFSRGRDDLTVAVIR